MAIHNDHLHLKSKKIFFSKKKDSARTRNVISKCKYKSSKLNPSCKIGVISNCFHFEKLIICRIN